MRIGACRRNILSPLSGLPCDMSLARSPHRVLPIQFLHPPIHMHSLTCTPCTPPGAWAQQCREPRQPSVTASSHRVSCSHTMCLHCFFRMLGTGCPMCRYELAELLPHATNPIARYERRIVVYSWDLPAILAHMIRLDPTIERVRQMHGGLASRIVRREIVGRAEVECAPAT